MSVRSRLAYLFVGLTPAGSRGHRSASEDSFKTDAIRADREALTNPRRASSILHKGPTRSWCALRRPVRRQGAAGGSPPAEMSGVMKSTQMSGSTYVGHETVGDV